jgi:glycosyltransferase involved in cell wall biosynthesis
MSTRSFTPIRDRNDRERPVPEMQPVADRATLTVEHIDTDGVEFNASGWFGPNACGYVADRLDDLLRSGAHVVINFVMVPAVDPAVAALLDDLAGRFRAAGGSLKIVGTGPVLAQQLRLPVEERWGVRTAGARPTRPDRSVPADDGGAASSAPLRVGIIAPPWVPVPPPVYGGTELMVDLLARGLVEAGHDVTLFTTGDSTCPVERRWHHASALGTNADLRAELDHVRAAYEALADVDVVHDHSLLGPLWARIAAPHVPVLTTSHGPFEPALERHFSIVAEHAGVIAISRHQRSTAPELPVTAVVHHGIDTDRVPLGEGRGGYVLFLGRMNPDKGVDRAIRAARAAGKRLVIAAKMWEPAEYRYFTEFVEPLLGPDAEYVGEVGGDEKAELLADAEALINPIRWPEPFGLVMIEALAAGTPVVTFPEGAAPEIVDHGETGFLCRDDADLAATLHRLDEIDRARCRAAAKERFSVQRMVRDHVSVYERHVAGRHALAGVGR